MRKMGLAQMGVITGIIDGMGVTMMLLVIQIMDMQLHPLHA